MVHQAYIRHSDFLVQLAPAALRPQRAQDGQYSSETEQAVSDRHDSSAPLGEAAATDTWAVTEPQGQQPLYIPPQALESSSAQPQAAITQATSLSAVLLDAPKDQQPVHGSNTMVSEPPAALRHSASLPNTLAALPDVAQTSIPDTAVPAAKPSPYDSLAVTQGKDRGLSRPECYSPKDTLGADNPNPNWEASNELQSAHSLPTAPAAGVVVAPRYPIATSGTAAVGSTLHNLPRNSTAGTLYRSAFQPYNNKGPSLGSNAKATADNSSSSQLRLACIPGSATGTHDHIGMQTGQGSKEPISEDKENVLPAAAGEHRLESQVLKGLDSMKASNAVNTSTMRSPRQSLEGTDGRGRAGSHSGEHEMAVGANAVPLGYCGAELGEIAASKRAKFTHGFD